MQASDTENYEKKLIVSDIQLMGKKVFHKRILSHGDQSFEDHGAVRKYSS